MSKTNNSFCQLCSEDERRYRTTIVSIDGFVLCANHAQNYIHQKQYPSTSVHRKTFDELASRKTRIEEGIV